MRSVPARRKRASLVSAALLVAAVAAYTRLAPHSNETAGVDRGRSSRAHVAIGSAGAPVQRLASRGTSIGLAKPVAEGEAAKPQKSEEWPELAPLSAEEQREYAVITEQIARFYDWGEIDQEELPRFQQALIAMRDRGLAHIARSLIRASQDTVKDPGDAKETIEKIDVLRYFAENGSALAMDATWKLVERGFRTDGNGTPLDRVEAQVALEAFEVLARSEPEAARFHLRDLPSDQVVAFSYHYLIGRRIAHEPQDETIGYLASTFGDAMVSYMKQMGLN
ncbi:hypothetical protein WME76_48340 (plasmid) [Sorangium sp. So ce119]|uniref:hypothetical protein n=1 Tax=Sorangium sp. So ce119 TaxID=3133279 RepID=UPI003F623382